jgi:hypothetical protein
MSIKNALAGVAVKDLSAAVQWYEKMIDKPPDSRPMAEVAEWKFERPHRLRRGDRLEHGLVTARLRAG